MAGVPIHRDLALRTLREHGPMSKADLADLLGPLGEAAGRAIATARHTQPGKFFRIVRYERQRGRSGRTIPIYSAQGGKDAPQPDSTSEQHKRQRNQRYYQDNRTRLLARVHARRGKALNPWVQLMPADRRSA